jgi:site-specific DNA-methyltransferase (adenine-specific)
MKEIPDGSVDLILTDPPYGTTACKWDVVIPFEPMWAEVWRVLKPNGACVLFGSEPFSTLLRCSQLDKFRYDWIWDKRFAGNFSLAKYQPLKRHEIVSTFYRSTGSYFPQKSVRDVPIKVGKNVARSGSANLAHAKEEFNNKEYSDKCPESILLYSNRAEGQVRLHPTQKPVALLEYLIKTYTLDGETVLDFTMGSGSTGVAARQTGRKFIGIERDEKYYQIARERIKGVVNV